MIQLECTNCKQTLTIEDAFAGGVCRCQFCGTIQTVPSNIAARTRPSPQPVKPGTAPEISKAVGKSPKALYRTPSAARSAGLPADPFAEITGSGLPGSGLPGSGIAGSGLNGGGLPSPRPIRPQAAPPNYDDLPDDTALLQGSNAAPMPIAPILSPPAAESPRSVMLFVLIGISLSVVVLLIVLIIILTGHRAPENNFVINPPTPVPVTPTPTPLPAPQPPSNGSTALPANSDHTPTAPVQPAAVQPTPSQPTPVAPAVASHPNPPVAPANKANTTFMGVAYTNLRSIAIVIDNGASQRDALPNVNRAVLNAIAGMPTQRTIAIEYWDSTAGPSYPRTGTAMVRVADSTGATVAAIMNNTPAATDPTPDAAMQKAVAFKPNAIMFITGRTIDDATRARLLAILRGSSGSKVFTFGIDGAGSDALTAIARSTGGQYKSISTSQLAGYAK